MTQAPSSTAAPWTAPQSVASFLGYLAVVLTVVMLLFPPYTSLDGTEYAWVLAGPEWSRSLGAADAELGLAARIYWSALLVQLGAVWAIALGAKWFLAAQRTVDPQVGRSSPHPRGHDGPNSPPPRRS